ncbi:uncharacterized protein [Dendrobates tinctorius]|uniref:uncharacterized protein isoform X1 n=1 Tax=Dendrobates tinctorius TaxID=92724 RepID=UPI003CC98D4C
MKRHQKGSSRHGQPGRSTDGERDRSRDKQRERSKDDRPGRSRDCQPDRSRDGQPGRSRVQATICFPITSASTTSQAAAEKVSQAAAETVSQAAAETASQPLASLSLQEATQLPTQLPQTVMSSPESSPSHHQRAEEADSEELPGGDVQGGETQGGGAQSSSESGARTRVTPRTSQGRQGDASVGRQTVSQRAPRRHLEEGVMIDTDELIREVENREPLWNMANRLHADQPTTRRLWDEVCSSVIENWEELNARARDFVRDRVITRRRSLRDRFKRDYNKEMQTPSGSGGRRGPQYKNYRALAFLRSTMVCRSTFCSTRESASELRPSGVIPSETAPGDHIEVSDPYVPTLLSHPSIPSTSTGAAGQTSSHEAAGDDLFPVPHPSDTAATSRPTFGSGRQRLRSQERMTLSDCLSLNSSVQHGFHTYGERLSSGLTMINQSIMELRRYMEQMNLESN